MVEFIIFMIFIILFPNFAVSKVCSLYYLSFHLYYNDYIYILFIFHFSSLTHILTFSLTYSCTLSTAQIRFLRSEQVIKKVDEYTEGEGGNPRKRTPIVFPTVNLVTDVPQKRKT